MQVGGATATVGDPSGRIHARTQLLNSSSSQLEHNVKSISHQLKSLFEKWSSQTWTDVPNSRYGQVQIVDNRDWWRNMGAVEFLSGVGRHIRVSHMLSRESVKKRFQATGPEDAGLTLSEFTYQTLQAYDFWHLHQTFGCDLQVYTVVNSIL